MAKLNTHVNVDGTWYGPGSEVPDEVAAQITNPKAWDGDSPAPAEGEGKRDGAEVKEPPRGGPGSSADAWRTFMVAKGYEVPEGASAKDMQSAWDDRDKG
jgi:hypothetical protein